MRALHRGSSVGIERPVELSAAMATDESRKGVGVNTDLNTGDQWAGTPLNLMVLNASRHHEVISRNACLTRAVHPARRTDFACEKNRRVGLDYRVQVKKGTSNLRVSREFDSLATQFGA